MKQNADGIVVCEKCGRRFEVGGKYVIVAVAKLFGEGRGFPNGLPLAGMYGQYFHAECFEISGQQPTALDTLKESLVTMSPKGRREIYLFLHDAPGVRL